MSPASPAFDGCDGLLLHEETAGGTAQLPELGTGGGDLAMSREREPTQRLAGSCEGEDEEAGVARVDARSTGLNEQPGD